MLAPATELEAVNSMLATIGESPVSSLQDSGVVDATLAVQTLREVNREVQSRGWHFNTDDDYPLVPAFPSKNIKIPRNTLRVETYKTQADMDITTRGGFLYNRKNHSFKFDGTVKVTIVTFLSFEDIPQFARTYIAVRAARMFQERTVGSAELSEFNSMDEARALVTLKDAEAETAGYNVLTDNDSVMGVMLR